MNGMIEYAAFGFVALKWWTWPVVFAVVLTAVYAATHLDHWIESRKPAPLSMCGALVASPGAPEDADGYGVHVWCHRAYGHRGIHRDEFGQSAEDYEIPDGKSE